MFRVPGNLASVRQVIVSKEAAKINHATASAMKCFHCGLRNFADAKQCKRCKSDLSPSLNGAKGEKPMRANSGEFGRPRFISAWILTASVVVLLGLVFLYLRQGPLETTQARGAAVVAQPPTAPDTEQPGQNAVERDSQSEAAATQVVTYLKRFQAATESGLDYNEYDKKLNSLKTDLNDTLPSFVRYHTSDESFREEVAAALRDYTAAGSWWKTTMTNGSVFSAADRNERTQRNFDSARNHLTNAEKTLVR